MKTNIKTDCGNSPKREHIKNLTIHFAAYDLDKVMEFLDEQVSWTLMGDQPIIGKEAFKNALSQMSGNKTKELTISSIITHGKEGAVNGEMLMEDGKTYGFSDFYEFKSAGSTVVKSIVSYVVEIGN